MSEETSATIDDVLVIAPGGGRTYDLGTMRGTFLADGTESDNRYCVSTWWVEPGSDGPGPHSHEANEELFYVIAGTMRFLLGDEWMDAPMGTFVRIPAGVQHDFANTSEKIAGVFNVFLPGGFEDEFASWYEGAGLPA